MVMIIGWLIDDWLNGAGMVIWWAIVDWIMLMKGELLTNGKYQLDPIKMVSQEAADLTQFGRAYVSFQGNDS